MPAPPFQRIRRFLAELKRRNVYRVAATYAVVAFVTLQAAQLIFPATTLQGVYDVLVVIAFIGFPLALVLAWAFETTPEGVRRTESVPPAKETKQDEGQPGTRRAVQILAALGLIAVAGAGLWQFTPLGDEDGDGGETTTPRIAVLPFENIAGDSANASFTSGMHTEVINQVSKVSGLEVISRTSVTGYANTDKRLPEISRELGGVDAIMEGTVRRAGDRVRINVQLIEAPVDEELWSSTYDRELSVDAIFDLQADVAQKIAGALETELTEGERRRIESAPTDDLAAYDAYLRGRTQALDAWHNLDPGLTDPAVRHLREAVSRDSTFAEAHAWLGLAYSSRRALAGGDRWLDSARASVDRALELDPELPDAYAVRGLLHQRDSPQAAEEANRRALKLDPNNALAADGMADLASRRGDYPEAIRWRHRALRVDPRWEWGLVFMGADLWTIGMLEEAALWFQQVREMNPENIGAVQGLARLYLSRGQPERAHRVVEDYRSRRPDHPLGLRLAAEVALHRGQPERARKLLEQLPEDLPDSPLYSMEPHIRRMMLGLAALRSGRREQGRAQLREATDSIRSLIERDNAAGLEGELTWVARGLTALGHQEEVRGQLRAALEAGQIGHQLLRVDPFFEDVRSEAWFQEILGQMEARQAKFRNEVRQMDLDPYPPGAETNP